MICKNCGQRNDSGIEKGDRVKVVSQYVSQRLNEIMNGEYGLVDKKIAGKEGTVISWDSDSLQLEKLALVKLDGLDNAVPVWRRHLRKL